MESRANDRIMAHLLPYTNSDRPVYAPLRRANPLYGTTSPSRAVSLTVV
jgi:hypothetical protein